MTDIQEQIDRLRDFPCFVVKCEKLRRESADTIERLRDALEEMLRDDYMVEIMPQTAAIARKALALTQE